MSNFAVTLAWILASIFMGITVFGCIANSLYGKEALFITCKFYLLINLATTIGFAFIAHLGGKALIPYVRALGIIYMLISLIGFATFGPNIGYNLSHDAYVNLLTYMIFLIGVILSFTGMILPKRLHLMAV